MISIWWLVLIIPVSILMGLATSAITSAGNFADKQMEIDMLQRENSELKQKLGEK